MVGFGSSFGIVADKLARCNATVSLRRGAVMDFGPMFLYFMAIR